MRRATTLLAGLAAIAGLTLGVVTGGTIAHAKNKTIHSWERAAKPTFFHSKQEVNYRPLIRSNIPLVRAKVGGKEVCALVDSGSDNNAIALPLAKKLRLKKQRTLSRVNTPAGPVDGYVTTPARIEVPSQFRADHAFIALPFPDIDCGDGFKVEVIFGQPMFKAMAIFIDNPNARIAFAQSGRLTPQTKRHLKIDWTDNKVDGEVEGTPVRMTLDTGQNEALQVNDKAFARYFADKQSSPHLPIRTAGGTITNTRKVDGVRLTVGGTDPLFVRAVRYPDTGWETPVVLGYAIFNNNPVIFDAGKEAIYVF